MGTDTLASYKLTNEKLCLPSIPGLLMKNLIKSLFKRGENSELRILYDPIEDTEGYKKIADEVDKKVVEIIGPNLGDGYCHCFWAEKKQILKEEYGIDWKSPAEMNMNITFD